MIKAIGRLAFVMALAACAGPQGDDLLSTERTAGADAAVLVEPVAEAPVAPVAPDTSCEDPGDGIGGTGCSVD